MTSSFPTQGQGIVRTPIVTPDEIIASMQGLEKLPGGVIIGDGSRTREVRVGEILAQLTADVTDVGDDNQYIPRKASELAVEVADNVTACTVDDAHVFAVGDTIIVQDSTGGGLISSIDYGTNVLTFSAISGGSNPHPINNRVYVAASGQWRADCIAGERYTPNASLSGITGRTSVYIGGLFKLAKLKGSAGGLDTAARAAFNGQDITAPEGTLVRVRLGDPTDLT